MRYQRSMRRTVAVKLLSGHFPAGLQTPSANSQLTRFEREVHATARLHHPNIVTVFEIGESAGQPYYAMQYVDGQNLAQIGSGQPLDGAAQARYVEIVARAVDVMHKAGVLHRDLKPSNILIERERDRPLVADLGLAKLLEIEHTATESGSCVGSPPYVSPEQIRDSAKVGVAADVYGLGATLYHLITGRPPFLAATLAETIQQVLTLEPVAPQQLNPSIDRDLSTICMKCLSKEPAARYATAVAFADDLERYLSGKPVLARPIGRLGKLTRWARRNRSVAALSAVACVSLLAGSVGSTILTFKRPAPSGRRRNRPRRAVSNCQDSRRQRAGRPRRRIGLALAHGIARAGQRPSRSPARRSDTTGSRVAG